MPQPPEADTERTFLTGVAEQLRQIREHLGFPEDAGGRGMVDPAVPRANYMRRLQNQLRIERDDTEPTNTGDPFGDYLADVAYQIEEGADRLLEQGRREWQGLTSVNGEVICCIVNGIYEILRSQGAADDVDSVRRVAEEDIRKWIRLLRELLVASRETLTTGGAASGQLSFEISLLNKDLTAILLEGIEGGLASVLFMVHEMLSDLARDADETVTDKIAKTRCAPLMRIWASIYDYLFSGANGILARTRAYLRDVLVRQARTRRKVLLSVGLGGEIEAEKRERYLRWIDDLINVLDALLASLSILSICRVPRPEDRDQNAGEAFVDPDAPGNPPIDPAPTRPADGIDDPGDGRLGDDDLGDFRTNASGLASTGNYSLVNTQDEDLGRLSVLEPEDSEDDYLYLTPTNVAALMTKEFGIEPSEALDIAQNQRCRDQISDETEELLVDLGVLPSQNPPQS